MKRTPLKRKTPLKRGGKLKPIADRKRDEYLLYKAEAREFIANLRRANVYCPIAIAIFGKQVRVAEVHHMAGREGKLLRDQQHWLDVSRKGHRWIHDHPNEARAYGWLYEVRDGKITAR